MKKIISLFQRNYDGDHCVRNQIVPGAEWVVAGEGIATRKFDGTCCLIRDGILFKRYDNKKGRTAPEGFEAAQEKDPVTGHQPGWIPVRDGPDDCWHREAFAALAEKKDGTYELCGPKIQNNPDQFNTHVLIPHGAEVLDAPRDYEALRDWLADKSIEGIVWHHPDGRMVKIKKKDFPRTETL